MSRSTASSLRSVIVPEFGLVTRMQGAQPTGGSYRSAVYDIGYRVVLIGILMASFKFAFYLALKQVHIAVHPLRLPYVYVVLLTFPPSPRLACRSLPRE